MDPTQMASATNALSSIFQLIGIHQSASLVIGGILSLLTLANTVASVLLLKLPMPSATSPKWYITTYSIIRYAALSFSNATPAAPGSLTVAKTIAPTSK